ncbi:MAG: isoprenylcysteine carboxyl methyltransferase family protein [Bacillota bacterium]|nr:isoprenylcysteine carboxyl methyltransferase family protein [Bacillota bacterium]
MQSYIFFIVLIFFGVRLVFLKTSKDNEKAILEAGGCEYGAENSKRLTILHILFYLGCTVESIIKGVNADRISMAGIGLMVFSLIMLYVVSNLLKGIWTVKLMVAKNHKFNDHWLFRTVKHPNYFLNILPELTGLTLLCHAYVTAAILSIPYLLVLGIRIKEENRVLKEIVIPNTVSK